MEGGFKLNHEPLLTDNQEILIHYYAREDDDDGDPYVLAN